jgi:hypothetical protein
MTPLQSFVQKGESEHLEFKARPRQAGIIFWMKNTQSLNNDNKADYRRYMGM